MTELEKGLLVMAVISTIGCIVACYFAYRNLRSKRKQDESDFVT